MSRPQFVTGTPCAFPGDAPAKNGCDLTAAGTQGHIAVGLGPDHACAGCVPAPTPSPVVSPTPEPTASPVPAPKPTEPVVATPAPTRSPVAVSTPAPTVDDGTCGNALWAKCDGTDTDGSPFSGEKCCPSGSYCNYQTQWYSQCIPNDACNKQPNDQCGGPGFWESNCCPAGHYCKEMSADGYSQCAPKSA